MNRAPFVTALGIALFLLAGHGRCDTQQDVQDALDAPDRPAADSERDLTSQPAAVLAFFGVPDEGAVLDLWGGGGYYSEIVSRAGGGDVTVYLHNNQAYLSFASDSLEERLRNDRLPNVVRYDREIDAIDLPDDSVDLVLMILTYHDLYYQTEGWHMDPDSFFTTVHRVLKPGGVLGVVDHVATAGSGNSAAQELHRIDPDFARKDIEAHGFQFDGAIDVLQNPADPLDVSVFDPSVRRHTSRFVYKFVEPSD
jgi:predicted methyltransferase